MDYDMPILATQEQATQEQERARRRALSWVNQRTPNPTDEQLAQSAAAQHHWQGLLDAGLIGQPVNAPFSAQEQAQQDAALQSSIDMEAAFRRAGLCQRGMTHRW